MEEEEEEPAGLVFTFSFFPGLRSARPQRGLERAAGWGSWWLFRACSSRLHAQKLFLSFTPPCGAPTGAPQTALRCLTRPPA
eukprot:837976-Pyramimonas_sp.AAC.1